MFKNKSFLLGLLIGMLIMSTFTLSLAAGNLNPINAFLNNGVKLMLNGAEWKTKDTATGAYYTPISYNGRLYLPLRAVIEEAAKMPVEFDPATQIVWINGKIEKLELKDAAFYSDYYGTILTTDAERLTTALKSYAWGVTNDKDVDMQYFTCFFTNDNKYKSFSTDLYVDSSAKAPVVFNIRKETYDGAVIKTFTLNPGETLQNITADIAGVNKACIETNIKINQGPIKKIVIGQPLFYNGELGDVIQ